MSSSLPRHCCGARRCGVIRVVLVENDGLQRVGPRAGVVAVGEVPRRARLVERRAGRFAAEFEGLDARRGKRRSSEWILR